MYELIQVSWIYWAVWLCSLARFCLRVLCAAAYVLCNLSGAREDKHGPWLQGLCYRIQRQWTFVFHPLPSVDTFIVDSRVNGILSGSECKLFVCIALLNYILNFVYETYNPLLCRIFIIPICLCIHKHSIYYVFWLILTLLNLKTIYLVCNQLIFITFLCT